MSVMQCYSNHTEKMKSTGKTSPPPELVEGEEVYKVKTICNHRKQGQGYQYYVKWWGYPISDASWEPEHAFSDDGKILAEYKQHHRL